MALVLTTKLKITKKSTDAYANKLELKY